MDVLIGWTTDKPKFLFYNFERLTIQIIHLNKNGIEYNGPYPFNTPFPILILITKMYLPIGVIS